MAELIVGMSRVRNEARWIERMLRSMLPVCERIFVLDDHSTDSTREICRSFKEVTLYESPFNDMNEARDKNFLLSRVSAECKDGTFVVHIDGDEQIDSASCDEIKRLASDKEHLGSYSPLITYLWDREDQQRTDGIYSRIRRPSFFHLHKGLQFVSPHGGGFHCSNSPNALKGKPCDVRLLHYGYMNREDRIRKFEWYNAPDKKPIPVLEDGYRHMVIGDLFPPDTKTKHAGPLELKPLYA